MQFKQIAKLASNVDPRDLALGGLTASRYTQAQKEDLWTPISLSVEVTYWCSRRCKGCYIPDAIKKDREVIDPEFLESIVSQAISAKVPFIGFAGGEPLSPVSRSAVYEVIRNHPLNPFFVYANGDYIKDAIRDIKRHHNMAYMISLDGLERNHDNIRGKGSFRNVTSAFQELGNARKIYGASVTVRNSSYEEIGSEKFFEYLAKNGVKFVRIRTLKAPTEEISEERTQEIIKRTQENAEKYDAFLSWGGLEDPKSVLPARDLLIGIDGTLRATRFALDESFGNLKTKSLRQVISDIRNLAKK